MRVGRRSIAQAWFECTIFFVKPPPFRLFELPQDSVVPNSTALLEAWSVVQAMVTELSVVLATVILLIIGGTGGVLLFPPRTLMMTGGT